MNDICQKCREEDEDLRTLFMSCFYDMSELDIPFAERDIMDDKFYTLRVCKSCRGDWLMSVKEWFEASIQKNTCDSGIYIREFGKLLQITAEEFHARRIKKKERYESKVL